MSQSPRDAAIVAHLSTLSAVCEQYPLLAAALLRHHNARGQPMSFVGRPSLVELYSVLLHDEADIVKAVQLGISELLIQLALYEAGWTGRIVAYVLPTQDLRNRFVGNRIDPLLHSVPAYRARLPSRAMEQEKPGESGNLRVKRFGAGQMLFLSAQTDGDFVEFSADTLVIDEFDLCWSASSSNLSKAKDRLREGTQPRMIRLGNPEMARAGIERLFAEGDGREWHWRCEHCGCHQAIDWEAQVVQRLDNGQWMPRDPVAAADPSAEIRPVCLKCRKPFERRAEGALWVPAHAGRRRSYRMTRWDSLRESLRFVFNLWVAAQASTLELRSWWRANAGRAWEPITGAVTREQILSASVLVPIDYAGGDLYLGRTLVSGVDVGSLFNVIVSELVRGPHGRIERRAVLVCTVETEEQVLDIWERYNVSTAVVDIGPERRISAKLRDEGRKIDCVVWLCEFHPGPKTSAEPFAMRIDWMPSRVLVDRTQIFDAATDAIRDGAYIGQSLSELQPPADPGQDGARLWPVDVDSVLGFTPQMLAPKRKIEGSRIIWDEGGAPDHYRLADVYDLLAMHLSQLGGS